jgi:beta-lactamase regulating signal transducer with metallopeptidase domain
METMLAVGMWNALGATLLAVVATSAGRVCRRPALLHVLWLLVLLKLLAPPLWAVPVRWPEPSRIAAATNHISDAALKANAGVWVGIGIPEQRVVPEKPESHLGARSELLAEPPALEVPAIKNDLPYADAKPDIEAVRPWHWPWLEMVVVIWGAMAVAFWGLTVIRVARFRRTVRQFLPADEALQQRAKSLAIRLGLKRCPVVCQVAAPISPMVWALDGDARLLLPTALWDGLTLQQRDLLMVHELAHLRRRDHWLRFLELFVVGLYWWLPIAWWARRRLQEQAELCCDAWVVAIFPEGATDYAAALVNCASYYSTDHWPVPAGASGLGPVPLLRRRVTMILKDRMPRRLSWVGMTLIIAAAAMLLPLWPTRADDVTLEPPEDSVFQFGKGENELGAARYWEQRGHPGAARFYYEIVMRRYPGPDSAEHAQKEMAELDANVSAKRQAAQPDPNHQPPTIEPPPQVEKLLPPGAPQPPPRAAPTLVPPPPINAVPTAGGQLDEIVLLEAKRQIEAALLDLALAELKSAADQGSVGLEPLKAAVQFQKAQLKYVEVQLQQARRRLDEPRTLKAKLPPSPAIPDLPTPQPDNSDVRMQLLESKIESLLKEIEFLRTQIKKAKDKSPEDGKAQSAFGVWAHKIFLNQTDHDFGTADRGAELRYSFPVKNIYAVPIEFMAIRSGSGCLTATPSKKVLQPQEEGTVDITLDTRRFTGPKEVTVYVSFGPEYNSTAVLRVSANAR